MKIGFSSFTFPYLSSLSLSTAGNLPLPPRYFPLFPPYFPSSSLLPRFLLTSPLLPYFPSSSSLLPLLFLLTSPLPPYFPSSSLLPRFLLTSPLLPYFPSFPSLLSLFLLTSPLLPYFPSSSLLPLLFCPHSRISHFFSISLLSVLFSYFVLRFQLAPFLLLPLRRILLTELENEKRKLMEEGLEKLKGVLEKQFANAFSKGQGDSGGIDVKCLRLLLEMLPLLNDIFDIFNFPSLEEDKLLSNSIMVRPFPLPSRPPLSLSSPPPSLCNLSLYPFLFLSPSSLSLPSPASSFFLPPFSLVCIFSRLFLLSPPLL